MKRIHFIGVKGIGISGLACYSKGREYLVSGSDSREKFLTDNLLKKYKIRPREFSEKNIKKNLDLAVYSSAYQENHPERKKAKELKIPQKSFFEVLAEIFNRRKNKILIAGTHGKTTTSSLAAHLLKTAGLSPTAFIGGMVSNWSQNFLGGKGSYIVAEGDEYQDKFLFFEPDYLLVTNIDYDHPDYFKSKNQYQNSFKKLIKKTKKKVLFSQKPPESFKKILKKINFPLLGEKNKENAYLVYKLAKELKIPEEKIKKAFKTFKGVERRMEIVGKFKVLDSKLQVLFIDDYAHHPEEIKVTLSALKENFPKGKILAIFQPHTFSRTKSLLSQFGKCFQKADFVFLLPTFSSAREKKPKENIDKILFQEIKKNHSKVKFLPFKAKVIISEIKKIAEENLNPNKVNNFIILTLGAGDIYKLNRQLAKSFLDNK